MKLLVGDLDRDFERPPVSGAVITLRDASDRQVPPSLAALSIEAISLLRPLVPRIRRKDRALSGQLVRAASDAAMHIAEAERAEPQAKKARYTSAAGAVTEALAALRVAVAWGYVDTAETEAPVALIGRMNAMLTRLTRL